MRLARVTAHLVRGVATAALLFPFVGRRGQAALIRSWSAGLLAALAVRVEVNGGFLRGDATPLCVVANHVSWLDIFVINATHPTRFVAKSDVRGWPVIGWLCERAGTLFVERHRRRGAARVNRAIAAALERGETVGVFPEGTTSAGNIVLPFHASLLEPALVCDAPVYPLAIRYLRGDGSLCHEADYTGDKSITASLLLMASQPTIRACLHVLPPIRAGAASHRKAVAREAAERIAEALGVPATGAAASATP